MYAPAATPDDGLSAAEVTINIIPGIPVLAVTSGYSQERINDLSTKIIRVALVLCAFQVAIQGATVVFWFSVGTVAVAAINIMFYVLILYLAIRCVKGRNARVCGCCRSLGLYRCYLVFTLVIVGINLILNVAWALDDALSGAIYSVINGILFLLNAIELHYSSQLVKELNVTVQPAAPAPAPPQAQAQEIEIPMAVARPVPEEV